LNKKANSINYNKVREAVAKNSIEIGKEDGQTNLADLFTKVITEIKRKILLKGILWQSQQRQVTNQVLGYGAPRQMTCGL
jgi:hypothetical protein